MTMRAEYTLKDREAKIAGESGECISGKCIFCGKELHHFNCHGEGWLLGAKVKGKPVEFLYCKNYDCTKGMGKAIWRCGCINDYVENVGPHCHACGCRRRDAKPVPE